MTNKIKPVENWEKKLEKLAFKVPSWSNKILRIEDVNRFISSLLQEQAEHFVKLGEDVLKEHNKDTIFDKGWELGYNQAISDLQEAIRTASLQATLIKNDKK